MKHLVVRRALWLAAFALLAFAAQSQNIFNPINDSTEARYRYEVEEYKHAELPAGTTIDQIDWSERDLLQIEERKKEVCVGINSAKEQYFQIINKKSFELEAWMSTPDLQLVTPTGSFGFDSSGAQVYYFPNNDVEQLNSDALSSFYLTEGFQPVMLFFPNKHSDFVSEAENNGATFYELPDNAFKLTKGNSYVEIRPKDLEIISSFTEDSTFIESHIKYTLFAPYGYVEVWSKERRTNQRLSHPVTFVETKVFSNHVIEDINGEIEKYTDQAHLEVYPSPVQGDYEIVLVGIPEAQVSMVQVRDHMGNIVQSHMNPSINEGMIALNGSSYPNGPLILIVSTNQGVYTETIQKIN